MGEISGACIRHGNCSFDCFDCNFFFNFFASSDNHLFMAEGLLKTAHNSPLLRHVLLFFCSMNYYFLVPRRTIFSVLEEIASLRVHQLAK